MADSNNGRSNRILAPLLLAALLAGCATIKPVLEQPAGFAEYSSRDDYRAVSPEGVVLRVRLVKNDPAQSLEFWTEALATQLTRSGYSLLAQEPLKTPAGDGMLIEWTAPVGEEQWVYLTGIAVSGSHIAIAEAAGEYSSYKKHREAIVASLRSLKLE
jgi:hypothetical protein